MLSQPVKDGDSFGVDYKSNTCVVSDNAPNKIVGAIT